MSIRSHVWGVSHEQDAVWSTVAGMDPERADRTLLMIWQAYGDESEKDDWFVIAGYVARVDQWAAFAKDWAPLARKYGRIDKDGRWHFHMSERTDKVIKEDLPALKNVINDHVLMGLGVAVRPSVYRNVTKRLVGFKGGQYLPVTGNLMRNHFLFCFELFLDALSQRAVNGLHDLDKIDLEKDRLEVIFDERAEEGLIRNAWDDFKASRLKYNLPNVLSKEPRFEDDKEFLPLQGADFFAYWLREAVQSLARPPDMEGKSIFPFGAKHPKAAPLNVIIMGEDELVERWESSRADEAAQILDTKKFVNSKLKL